MKWKTTSWLLFCLCSLIAVIVCHSWWSQPTLAKDSGFRVFYASLTGKAIVPEMVETTGGGGAGAILKGNKLRVSGSFANLSGNLRDFVADPVVPPNPNITSAVHIHRGAVNQNGPFQFSLKVSLKSDSRSGEFSGEYDLTSEQVQALLSGQLYLDLHTVTHRGGELRGVFQEMSK